jgi:hypothetical protein
MNAPRVMQNSVGQWSFPPQSSNAPGSGKSMQTLNLSNLIATCKKLLHFANCAYLKLVWAARKHYTREGGERGGAP